jgi:ribosome-binding factor A
MAGERGVRAKRVGEGVREELASLLVHYVKDPRAKGVVVTGVEMTPDLREARVKVRLLEGAGDAEKRSELVQALTRASGMLRREVTHRLRLRHAPTLRFAYDDGTDKTSRVAELLAEIEAERRSR